MYFTQEAPEPGDVKLQSRLLKASSDGTVSVLASINGISDVAVQDGTAYAQVPYGGVYVVAP